MTRETVTESFFEGELPRIIISPREWTDIDTKGGLTQPSSEAQRNLAVRALIAYSTTLHAEINACSPEDVRDELHAIAKPAQKLLDAIVKLKSNMGQVSSKQTARELARERLERQCPGLDFDSLIETLAMLRVYALEPVLAKTKGRAGKNASTAERQCVNRLAEIYRLATGKTPNGHARSRGDEIVIVETQILARLAELEPVARTQECRALAKELENTVSNIEDEVRRYCESLNAGDWQPEVYWMALLLSRVPDAMHGRSDGELRASVAHHLNQVNGKTRGGSKPRKPPTSKEKLSGSKLARKSTD